MKGYDHNQEDVFRAVGISEEREAELKGMFNDMRKLENMKKSEIFEMISQELSGLPSFTRITSKSLVIDDRLEVSLRANSSRLSADL